MAHQETAGLSGGDGHLDAKGNSRTPWRRHSLKRGGDREREPLDVVLETIEQEASADFDDLHYALEELEQQSPRQYEVVNLRFFGGLTIQQTADMMELSPATIDREWQVARAKLLAFLKDR